MMLTFLGFILGAAASWAIAHHYFVRSNQELPDWAKPLIERFGADPPSREQLVEYFNEAVAEGTLIPHVPLGYVTCPSCKAPSSELEYSEAQYPGRGDHARAAVVRCEKCGWEEFLGDV